MSKNTKINENSSDSYRASIIKSRRANQMLNPTPSSSKLMIGKQESPYSKIQGITKTRSSSSLKAKAQIKLKNISPARFSNIPNVLQSNDSKRIILDTKSTSNNSLSHSFTELKDYNSENLHSSTQEALHIDQRLTERLKDLQTCRDSFSRSERAQSIYKSIFNEVILKAKPFASTLKKIQEFYESFIAQTSIDSEPKELKIRLKELASLHKSQQDQIKDLEKRLEKSNKESQELNKRLDRSQEICTELQKKICHMSSFHIEQVPKDDAKWKALIVQNKRYRDAYKSAKEELTEYKYREKKLVKLLMVLKDKGFPVEEIYQEEVVNKRKKSLPRASHSSIVSSNSENENLVSGRAPSPLKPLQVPGLNLDVIEPESFSSDSYTESISNSSSLTN